MDLLQTVRKEGSRGGRAEFKWEDVKNDAQRENYLGHSLMAPVGRWQQGRDLNWYTKGDAEFQEAEAARIAEEKRRLKEAEADAMLAAMGLPVPVRETENANLTPLGKKVQEEDIKDKIEEKAREDKSEERARKKEMKERSRRHRDDDGERKRRHRSRSQSGDRHRERRHKYRDRSRSREPRRDDNRDTRDHRRRHRSRSRDHKRRNDRPERPRERDTNDQRSRSHSRERRHRRDQRSRSPYEKTERKRD